MHREQYDQAADDRRAPTGPKPDRRSRISELFDALLALDEDTRSIRLGETSADDPSLAAEVASLLAAHDSMGVLDRLAGEMVLPGVDLPGSSASSDELSGTVIAQYEVGELIGGGGMVTCTGCVIRGWVALTSPSVKQSGAIPRPVAPATP